MITEDLARHLYETYKTNATHKMGHLPWHRLPAEEIACWLAIAVEVQLLKSKKVI